MSEVFERDQDGVLHVLALSGGHDSTALAFLLKEHEPRLYNYVCTPTGDELPEMFAHWVNLGNLLGRRLIPIMAATSLDETIRQQRMIPNFQVRFCTRIQKIEPYRKILKRLAAAGPVVSYVGLRADEPGRAGGAYDDIDGVTMRFPLREWGMGEKEVQDTLTRVGVTCPDRTDCGKCYHQRLGEWWEYRINHREASEEAVALEEEMGGTFRTPGRDTWPTALKDLFALFDQGEVPTISLNRMKRERMNIGACRVCSL